MAAARLGAAGPLTSRLGLGCLPLGGAYGPADPAGAVRLIRLAMDSGVALLDAADLTHRGEVLRLVGRAVADRRDEVTIAAHSRPARGPARAVGDPRAVAAGIEAALRRLGTDHVDLYYLHPGRSAVPIEDQIGLLAGQVTAGKVRHLGLGGGTAEQLVRAHRTHPIAALAVEYSLWRTRAEREQLPAARRLGIGVVAVRPLGRGLLTGRLADPARLAPDDLRRADLRFAPGRLAAARARLAELERTAAGLDVGAGRLALAWLLSRGEDVVPVPGTRDPVHLEMNLAAAAVRLPEGTGERLAVLFEDRAERAGRRGRDGAVSPGSGAPAGPASE
ncbi:aldo/keto reductase [Kitasatospora sp. NPDC051853]|uniref:aldo/keto reductase n=1 Tax=Kitasatospora sp. NPDC051853 TaxID=3364058 RepID=UPI00379619E2